MTSDHTLIESCKKQDSIAQRELYNRYRSKWFVICLRYMSIREDALDVLQLALVKIYTNIQQFDNNRGSFGAWSSRIVVNECIMHMRKHVNKRNITDLFVDDMYLPTFNDAISQMTAQEILQLIKSLPEGYRLVFNMYVMEGYSHKDIATELGISVGTSKSQLFKAKKLLREKLESVFSFYNLSITQ